MVSMAMFGWPGIQDKSFFPFLDKFYRGDRNILGFLEAFINKFLSGLTVFLMILRLPIKTSSFNFKLIGCTYNSASNELVGVDSMVVR